MMVNIAYALLGALKVAVKETRSPSGDLKGAAVEKVIQELLHVSKADISFESLLTFSAIHRSSRPLRSQCSRRGFGTIM